MILYVLVQEPHSSLGRLFVPAWFSAVLQAQFFLKIVDICTARFKSGV